MAAFRRISSTSFTITNRPDLHSNYHTLTLDVHTGIESFRIYNVYHDAHTNHEEDNESPLDRETRRRSLEHITGIDLDPMTPTVFRGDFNTHARAWSPPEIRQSPWAIDIEEWAISQVLDLLNLPGIPTCCGDRRQRDTTIDLIWVNEATLLDDTFHDLDINFADSLGSDHAAMGLSFFHVQANPPQHNPLLPPYLLQDTARERWIAQFRTLTHPPILLVNPAEIDTNTARLVQCIENTSSTIFEPRKEFSPRAARWWNDDCQAAVVGLHNAASDTSRSEANQTLKLAVRKAKREWANNLLHNASTTTLWRAAQWRHGRRMRSISALTTEVGLTNDTAAMTAALSKRFFNEEPPAIPCSFPDDPAPLPQRAFHVIMDAEIEDTLAQTSNQSAPGKSGHGYKLIKWAWEATPDWIANLFNSCMYAGYHLKQWCHALTGAWSELS